MHEQKAYVVWVAIPIYHFVGGVVLCWLCSGWVNNIRCAYDSFNTWGQGVTWRSYSLCEMRLCGKNLLGGGPVMVLQYLFPSQIDAIGGVPDVDKNSWGSFWWWMNKPLRTVLKGPKKPETQKSKLRRFFCHRWVGNTKLSLGDFSVQTWVWGPNTLVGDFSYPRLGWQVQACFGSFVLAKGRLGGEGETEIGKSFVPKDGFKGPSMSWGGFSCPPHGVGIQGLVWEVFLEARPHHERESAGVQVPT